MSQVIERQQHWLTCSQYLCPQMHMHTVLGGFVAAEAVRTVSSIMRLWLLSWGGIMSLPRHMATMDTLAALGWSIWYRRSERLAIAISRKRLGEHLLVVGILRPG